MCPPLADPPNPESAASFLSAREFLQGACLGGGQKTPTTTPEINATSFARRIPTHHSISQCRGRQGCELALQLSCPLQKQGLRQPGGSPLVTMNNPPVQVGCEWGYRDREASGKRFCIWFGPLRLAAAVAGCKSRPDDRSCRGVAARMRWPDRVMGSSCSNRM